MGKAEAMGNAKSVKGIVIIVATVLALIGWILVLIAKSSTSIDICALLWVIGAIMNLCILLIGKVELAVAAGALCLSSCDTMFTAMTAKHAETLFVIGMILVFFGTLVTFWAWPIQWGKPSVSGVINILGIVVAALLIIGNILLWIDGSNLIMPFFLGILYIIGVLMGFDLVVDLTFYAAAFLLHYWTIVMFGLSGLAEFAAILIWAALVLIMILHFVRLAKGMSSSPVVTHGV